jgi:diguanylate cyclase (GGDEF)-like protein
MPDTPLSGAFMIAERLRAAVAKLAIAHAASVAADRVTLSVGDVVATTPQQGPDKLLAAADAALYRAKRDGRNRSWVVPLDGAATS